MSSFYRQFLRHLNAYSPNVVMLLLVSDVVFCNSKKKNNLLFEPKRVIIKTM